MQNKEMDQEKSVNEKNVEIFNRYFPGCLSIENDDKLTLDVERLKALLGDFSEIKEEGYGLDFVGKKIALNEAFKKNNKILKPLNESTSKHILIKGDNLDALKILKQSYSEKIKMIYIDPPYNTKNDNFIYSDDFSQSNEETLKQLDYSKEKLDYIKNLFGSKCHSGWLRFMYPRLLLAKDLLKQDGVIFISIDDNECAQLKLLCDEIFGEGNFVACLHVELSATQGMKVASAKKGNIVKNAEYILIYAKNIENFSFIRPLYVSKNYDEHYSIYLDPKTKKRETLLNFLKSKYENMTKDKIIAFYNDDKDFRDFIHKNADNIYREHNADLNINLTHEQENKLNNNEIIEYGEYLLFKNSNNKIRQLIRLSEDGIGETDDFDAKFGFRKIRGDWWAGYYKDMGNINKEGDVIFKNGKKPVRLIKDLLKISTTPNSNDIILDFFAGSGTTAHAVLESNKSDYQKLSEGGGLFNGLSAEFKERRFILVQLDEKIDPKKNKSAHDFCLNTLKSPSPSIFDITEERIKRAGAKIKEDCPPLDVGFQAFEIIDDETHANDKNLSQAKQEDLFAYSNLDRMETQTILIKLLGCEGLELTTPIICLIENALYLAQNTAFIVGDIEMSEVLENLKDKGVEKISMYIPAISNDRLCLELGSNLFDLKLESGDLKIRG